MGERGYAGKPDEQKELEGVRSDRINPARPQLPYLWPAPPADMTRDALRVWEDLKNSLEGSHYVTRADGNALRTYCDLVARYRETERMYQTMGPIVEHRTPCKHSEPEICLAYDCPGYIVTKHTMNPLVRILSDLSTQIRAYSREFGLTPSARSAIIDPSRLPGGPKGTGDDLF